MLAALSSSGLSRGSSHPRALEQAVGWMVGPSPTMPSLGQDANVALARGYDRAICRDERIGEAHRLAGLEHARLDLQPLADLGRADVVDRQAHRTPGPEPTAATRPQLSPMALSASAAMTPPCSSPRELQCAARRCRPICTAPSSLRENSGSQGSVTGLLRKVRGESFGRACGHGLHPPRPGAIGECRQRQLRHGCRRSCTGLNLAGRRGGGLNFVLEADHMPRGIHGDPQP